MKKLVTWGWSWDGVTKKLWDIAWNLWIAASASSTESWWDTLAERISPALYSLMVFNSDTKVKEVRRLTQGFKAENKNWEEFYELSCS